MAQSRVFLSHSSKDATFTTQLEADLQVTGATVYRVSADQGGDFIKRIDDALAACEWVALVLTKDALESPWVQQEVRGIGQSWMLRENTESACASLRSEDVDRRVMPNAVQVMVQIADPGYTPCAASPPLCGGGHADRPNPAVCNLRPGAVCILP